MQILRCGPPPMNKAVAAHLDALGYSPEMQFQFQFLDKGLILFLLHQYFEFIFTRPFPIFILPGVIEQIARVTNYNADLNDLQCRNEQRKFVMKKLGGYTVCYKAMSVIISG